MARNRIRPATQAGSATTVAHEIPRSADNPNPKNAPNSPNEMNTIVERANGDTPLTPAPIRGGSYGVIPEAIQRIGVHVGRPIQKDSPAQRQPKKFIITGPILGGTHPYAGKITFMYDHQRVYVNPGKEVTANMYDLDLLRRQGCRLEEVIDPLGDSREPEPEPEAIEPDESAPETTDESEEHGDDAEE